MLRALAKDLAYTAPVGIRLQLEATTRRLQALLAHTLAHRHIRLLDIKALHLLQGVLSRRTKLAQPHVLSPHMEQEPCRVQRHLITVSPPLRVLYLLIKLE